MDDYRRVDGVQVLVEVWKIEIKIGKKNHALKTEKWNLVSPFGDSSPENELIRR